MHETNNGRYQFVVEYRDVEIDHGLTLHIYGPTKESQREEVLRFDCFANQPHYHLAWSYRQAPFVPIHAADPFAWTLALLRDNAEDLLRRASALPMYAEELALLDATLHTVERHGKELAETH